MINTLKNISFYLLISFLFCFVSHTLQSKNLLNYLSINIIGLLFTLLAINTATSGLIASKMQDLVFKFPRFDFKETIKQMKLSLFEQIILIVISAITITLQGSKLVDFSKKEFTLDIILVSIMIYSIDILWDTGRAVFVVIEEIQKMNNK
jgi:hypothetical protein